MKRIAILPLAALLACSPQAGENEGEMAVAERSPDITKLMVDLGANGITIPAQDGDEARVVPFGTVRATTEDSLVAALGNVKDRQTNKECPAGPVSSTTFDGITLNFQSDKFVGWSASGSDYVPDLTRAELSGEDNRLKPVEDSSLGAEYFIGDDEDGTISLLFDSDDEASKPNSMWAGVNCIFR
ncbi:hypothetical protein [Altererythrobacter sp.]|uniref:hypothetical protein n=1 Tax=Altererythrobacter sp. TaxID=1872480 RepID=UPI003D026619